MVTQKRNKSDHSKVARFKSAYTLGYSVFIDRPPLESSTSKSSAADAYSEQLHDMLRLKPLLSVWSEYPEWLQESAEKLFSINHATYVAQEGDASEQPLTITVKSDQTTKHPRDRATKKQGRATLRFQTDCQQCQKNET